VLVLGFTAEEQDRYDDWLENWPDRPVLVPLIERGLTKEDCKAMVQRAGIEIPRCIAWATRTRTASRA
jgi:hypothetical protein